MLRVLIMLVLGIAALWYFTRDSGQSSKIAEEQRETLELAKEAAAQTEEISAAMAVQSDAVRDAARSGISGQAVEEPEAQ